MTCVHCSSRSCVVHQIPFHEGETCSEYDNRMNQLQNELLAEQGGQPEASGSGARTGQKRKRINAEQEDVEPQIKHEVEQSSQGPVGSIQRSAEFTRSLEEGNVKKRPRLLPKRRWAIRQKLKDGEKQQRLEEEHERQQRLEEERQRQRQKEILQGEMASNKALESHRRCPGKRCGYWIEKRGGCDHMTCRPSSPNVYNFPNV